MQIKEERRFIKYKVINELQDVGISNITNESCA